jgi:hypothetical protein
VRQGIEDHGDNTERHMASLAETDLIAENSTVVVDFNRSQGK